MFLQKLYWILYLLDNQRAVVIWNTMLSANHFSVACRLLALPLHNIFFLLNENGYFLPTYTFTVKLISFAQFKPKAIKVWRGNNKEEVRDLPHFTFFCTDLAL